MMSQDVKYGAGRYAVRFIKRQIVEIPKGQEMTEYEILDAADDVCAELVDWEITKKGG